MFRECDGGSAILVVGDANAILGDKLNFVLSCFGVIVYVDLSVRVIVATRQLGAGRCNEAF